MKNIKVLPQLLVDKIAAGEVIERPASVVKELLENAIDAGTSEIKVEIEDGGKKLIRITDNGKGIPAEDLSLVFVRHATSKIKEDTDLYQIKTLGFRGEALASIAAVSQCSLVSNPENQAEAWVLTAQAGKAENPQPSAGEKGSTIEIRNLFFNMPARAKFLKSTPVELGHITDIITRYALAYPEIRFDFTHQGKIILNLPPASDVLERIAHFFGNDFARELIKTEYRPDSAKGTQITAYLSTPTQTKPTLRHQYFYLNRRFIRDRILTRAVIQAYSDFIPAHRFPVIFWFMKLSPDDFDVNVHPTKIEVRFRNTWAIHDLVIKTIRQALTTQVPTGSHPVTTSPLGQEENLPEKERVLQAMVDFFAGHPHPAGSVPTAQSTIPSRQGGTSWTPDETSSISSTIATPEVLKTGHRHFQFHNTYIIEEAPDGLIIIDQHALHERILYNRLKRDFFSQGIYRQQLLIPASIELEPKQMALLEAAQSYLNQLGFEIEEFGKNTIRLLAIPTIVDSADHAELIKTIIDDIDEGHKEPKEPSREGLDKIMERLLMLIACKSAIKAGALLNDQEITSLLAQRERTDYHLTCPHGRPAVFKLTLAELEKRFQR